MRTSDKNITKHQEDTGISPAGTNLCLRQRGTAAYLGGSSIDELGKILVARGEQRIEETSDWLIAQLHEGKLLSEEAISRISGEVAEKVVSKILPDEVESQRSFVSSINRLVQTKSKALRF